ncbi:MULTISPECIES: ribosome-associated heat shock protein Hsp15 [unclassified Shewanella]|uniref:ribosome-associated heat shock protein Hsp15 n=1 Tax=unclassified Shewanella TaxID=196818 RepID=UPI000C83C32F|nr:MULTISPECIES: ribosome-associated heat shock protein Hsp15 [unclassified Shewanella]MDO6619624.1 ribosome-associated heat shock protein Hsp15 [Shewanella sp. 6_MG-2023]MDO6640579.1 ribosome-associated heat shock protein Hsp15 [Shewanella sp. 5_MG-2023]MDO6678712.1 ribosome-associated heat shock protein Hsp15 [Shewanella sp. 4_MG-2023]MDO6775728.1 ribosome-associated heat shock protein Hsp15 [Shewanella sp. 3_MG-2023]PMG29117.1 RNA-binding protein [Shewanella sp. 10N.286.52.C2]
MSIAQVNTMSVRLDKWLWAARFYKTRSLAKDMINGGKVHYNGQRAKSSKLAEVGATVRLRQGHDDREIIIAQLSEHRQGAAIAQTLYQETAESIKKREFNAEARRLNILNNPAPETKPDKKQRRQLKRFKEL